jgi:hypothetical protein
MEQKLVGWTANDMQDMSYDVFVDKLAVELRAANGLANAEGLRKCVDQLLATLVGKLLPLE